MKKKLGRILILLCIIAPTLLVCDEAFIQVSSSVTQTPAPPSKGGSQIQWDNIELIKNFQTSPDNKMVLCKIPGYYLVSASFQPGTTTRGVSGYLDAWFEINGKPVPGSNARQSVNQDTTIANMTNTLIVKLNTSDVFSTRIFSDAAEVGIIADPNAGSNEPSITSFILSLTKIKSL